MRPGQTAFVGILALPWICRVPASHFPLQASVSSSVKWEWYGAHLYEGSCVTCGLCCQELGSTCHGTALEPCQHSVSSVG